MHGRIRIGSVLVAAKPGIQRWFVVLVGTALLVGLTAGPLAAASSTKKTYSVNVTTVGSVTPSASGFSAEFNATYTNTTPGGTSSVNSLTLTLPPNSTLDVTKPATFTTTTQSPAGTLRLNATAAPNIAVTNLYPVSYGQSVTLDFWATIPIAPTCSSTVSWATQAFTGSNLSGTAFTLSAFSTNVGTSLAAGSPITVNGVTVTNLSTTTCIPVTITRSGNQVQILKPSVQDVALIVYIKWDPEIAQTPLPPTKVDNNGSGTYSPIPWCTGTWNQGTPTDTSGVTWTTNGTSCLLGQQSNIAGSNTVQLQEWMYLLGDWGAQR